jgi:ferredoxin
MKRKIINIDEKKCNGCELCIPECPEGAIQIIDGKARLISDLFCDGLGACLGYCPEGAITIEEREAEPYDERKVMENIVKQGNNTIRAHLLHLKEHDEKEFLHQAVEFLKENSIDISLQAEQPAHAHLHGGGCPGSQTLDFEKDDDNGNDVLEGTRPSQLTHWPIQMHLLSPHAPHYQGADLLLAADCVAFTMGDFHKDYLQGKTLAIACPKLDSGQQVYQEKLKALIEDAKINTLTVMIMQVPCCRGMLMMAEDILEQSSRKVPLKCIVVGLQGNILTEEWM